MTAELIRCGIQNESMDMLERPVVLHEFRRQPVEKFGMSRWHSGLAKIARCRHKSLAEMKLPQSIDDDACRQGVGLRRHPLGQSQPPLLFGRGF